MFIKVATNSDTWPLFYTQSLEVTKNNFANPKDKVGQPIFRGTKTPLEIAGKLYSPQLLFVNLQV